MKNLLEYKGYYGSVEYSREDALLYGKVLGINSLISYEGESVAELQQDFEGAVDDYLEMCAENGTEPEKTYKGSFNVRIAPQLHKKLSLYSISQNKSLNATVEEAVAYLRKEGVCSEEDYQKEVEQGTTSTSVCYRVLPPWFVHRSTNWPPTKSWTSPTPASSHSPFATAPSSPWPP